MKLNSFSNLNLRIKCFSTWKWVFESRNAIIKLMNQCFSKRKILNNHLSCHTVIFAQLEKKLLEKCCLCWTLKLLAEYLICWMYFTLMEWWHSGRRESASWPLSDMFKRFFMFDFEIYSFQSAEMWLNCVVHCAIWIPT